MATTRTTRRGGGGDAQATLPVAEAAEDKPLRILELRAENFKILKAARIQPDGHVVEITGNNGQGKTSILDAIIATLAGGKHVPPKPVRNGQAKAFVEIDLGDLVVQRTFTPDGKSRVTVMDKPGRSALPSPQAVLDKIIGAISFRPLEFVRMHPKQQVATLMELVGLGPKLAELDGKRQRAYEERTLVNREVDRLEKRMEAIPDYPEDLPEEEESAEAIIAELNEAQETANLKAHASIAVHDARVCVDRQDRCIAELEVELAQAREKRSQLQARLDQALKECEAIKAPKDEEITAIRERLTSIEQTNARIRERAEFRRMESEFDEKSARSQQLTLALEKVDALKAKLISEAPFPVPGLGFGGEDEGVTLNGVPLSQASQGEQLKATAAIAMALNPKLRVCLVDEASVLDRAGMAELYRLAEEHDMQVWLTRVNADGGVGIVIEDGEIVQGA